LSPEIESFLRDMCELEKTPTAIASFLDKRERNITAPKIAQVEIDSKIGAFVQSTSDLISKTTIAFEEQIARMEDKHRKSEEMAEQRAMNLTNQIANLTATISKLSFQENQIPARENRPAQNQFSAQNSFQRRPRFCNFCKVDTHYRSACPFITCFLCGQKGHMQNKCPSNQNQARSNPSASQPADNQQQNKNLNA